MDDIDGVMYHHPPYVCLNSKKSACTAGLELHDTLSKCADKKAVDRLVHLFECIM